MFGNLMSNSLIKKAIDSKAIDLGGFFEQKNLEFAHYRLSAHFILCWDDDKQERAVDLTKHPYKIEPGEYVRVTVRERVVLSDGIIGRFVPASELIDLGLTLTCGKLDPQYGLKNEQIVFGLYNAGPKEITYASRSPLAHIEFFDLRGVSTAKYRMTEEEKATWKNRAEYVSALIEQMESEGNKY